MQRSNVVDVNEIFAVGVCARLLSYRPGSRQQRQAISRRQPNGFRVKAPVLRTAYRDRVCEHVRSITELSRPPPGPSDEPDLVFRGSYRM